MIVKMNWGILGLMFRSRCDVPIIFPGTRTIHMIGVSFPIDILFLDKYYKVIDKCDNLWAWKGVYHSNARGIQHVIESNAGDFKKIKVGDKIEIKYI